MDGVIIANPDKPVKPSAALAEHYVRGALRLRVYVLASRTSGHSSSHKVMILKAFAAQ